MLPCWEEGSGGRLEGGSPRRGTKSGRSLGCRNEGEGLVGLRQVDLVSDPGQALMQGERGRPCSGGEAKEGWEVQDARA